MSALRELFAKFDVDFDSSSVHKGAAAVDGLWGKLQGLGSALAGGAIIGGLTALTHSVIREGDALSTTADRLGIATQALQQWTYVADLADVSQEEMSAGLRILQKNLYEAATAGGDAAASFVKLGLTSADLKEQDLDVVLTKASEGFAKLTNPVEKTALALKLLGRGGAALVPLLSRGPEGIKALKDEFIELGGGLNDETIAAANAADDAFKRLNFAVKSLVRNAVTPLILGAIKVSDYLRDWVKGLNKAAKGTNAVNAVLVTLGIVATALAFKVLIAFAPLILSTIAWGAAIAVVVLAIDDLMTLFQGGDSIIGRWIDDNYGAGKASEWVQKVKDWWDELGPSLSDGWELFKQILPSIQDTADALRAMGHDIAFVVDQFRDLLKIFTGKSEFLEGLKLLGHDIKLRLGIDDKTELDTARDNVARGLVPSSSHARPIDGDPGQRGGFYFNGLTRFGSDKVAPPRTIGPPLPPGMKIENNVNLQIDANAAPTPGLSAHIERAVKKGLDANNRELLAGVRGS